ncbi:hypothetical protein NQ527_08080 [Eshraghiella crossota]|nr:hypothetical protein [Butyrivibrio crossotus]UWO49898.1 hypothetical protein NQ527_08080 [Butyrivibrio crossotus]
MSSATNKMKYVWGLGYDIELAYVKEKVTPMVTLFDGGAQNGKEEK